jgi:hypothetical protein
MANITEVKKSINLRERKKYNSHTNMFSWDYFDINTHKSVFVRPLCHRCTHSFFMRPLLNTNLKTYLCVSIQKWSHDNVFVCITKWSIENNFVCIYTKVVSWPHICVHLLQSGLYIKEILRDYSGIDIEKFLLIRLLWYRHTFCMFSWGHFGIETHKYVFNIKFICL